MVSFHTSIHNLYPWKKTLDSLYYNLLGNSDEYNIKWCNDPKVWEDSSDNNSIVTEFKGKDNLLAWSVTFFITTSTVQVWGSKQARIQKIFPGGVQP